MDGFTYRGRHCSELGVNLLSYTINTPELREHEDEADGVAGVIDYGTEWGKREISLRLDITPNGLSAKERQSHILTWLNPTLPAAALIFDEMPEWQFMAKMSGRLGLESFGTYGVFEVTLKCSDPMVYQSELTTEISWDSPISMDRDDITFDDQYEFTVTGPTTVEVNNFGQLTTGPVIQVAGSFTTLTITANGKTLVYNEPLSSGTLIIDCRKFLARVGSANKLFAVSGEWLEFERGFNEVLIGGTGLNCTVSFPFRPQYL